jgi:hypothetical protein
MAKSLYSYIRCHLELRRRVIMYEVLFLFLGKCIPGGLEVLVLCPQCTDILYNFWTFKKFFSLQNLHLSGRMLHQLSVCEVNVHFTGCLSFVRRVNRKLSDWPQNGTSAFNEISFSSWRERRICGIICCWFRVLACLIVYYDCVLFPLWFLLLF